MTWFTDENGNRASLERWGSEGAARAALDALNGCSRCSDCSDCFDCSRCSDCSGCFDCSDCSDCSRCSGCSGCSGCSDCSDCSRCSRCSGLKGASPVESEVSPLVIPKIENIHQRLFAAVSQPEALNMDTWHTCETTHCRAGWVVTLAGEEGRKLEKFHNPELAAMLIYEASGYLINPARFFDGDEAAMADMKRLAELEAAK